MRRSLILLAWFVGTVCPVSSVLADIEYHFVPELDGQPSGYAQFADVAPVVGPQDFEVRISGALLGSAPSDDSQSAFAYLDKWGLGVLNPQAKDNMGMLGQVLLDGNSGGEYLRLEFPVEVQLTYLTFAFVGSADCFDLFADGQQVNLSALFPGTSTIQAISDSQGNWPGHIDFTRAAQPLSYAKIWDVAMCGPGYGDGIQLENVGVQPIPEPSTLMLLLTGFAAIGIGLTRRRIVLRRERI